MAIATVVSRTPWTTEQLGAYRQAREPVRQIVGPGHWVYKVVTLRGDDPNLQKIARSKEGGFAAVVIQMRPDGHVAIFTNWYNGLELQEIVSAIRIAEMVANGLRFDGDPQTLMVKGVVNGAEAWYFDPEKQMLLNGSDSRLDAPPTKIDLGTIQKIVYAGVSVGTFKPKSDHSPVRAKPVSSRSDNGHFATIGQIVQAKAQVNPVAALAS